MTAAVENMAYAGTTPWHGLGNKVSDRLTPAEMLVAAGLDWTVSKQPLKFGTQTIKGWSALQRDTDKQFLSIVGSRYKPVQNEKALDFFRKFVKAGSMKMETAGSLWTGRYVWALAKVNGSFGLKGGDEVASYLLLSQPHVIGKAMQIKFTGVRVVCWNTLSLALGSSLSGANTSSFRMPHSIEFTDAVRAKAEEALGLARDQAKEFESVAKLLSRKRALEADVDAYFGEVMGFDPTKAKANKDGVLREPTMIPMFRHALEHAPGQQLASALGTWWGALNAVTYVVDHEIGKTRDTALRAAWLGDKANLKRKAIKLAVEAAS